MIYSSYIDRLERKFNKDHKLKASYEDPFSSELGNSIQPVREYSIVDGIKQLVISGKTDLQESIDSFAESTDINVVINKFLNGDISVLNPANGSYGDFRNCPTTYAEMFDRVQRCQNIFESMPVEIKEKFDNSYEKFWSSYGSDYFDSAFAEYDPTVKADNNVPVEVPVEKGDIIDA